ncbi:hypothetical protein PI125_g4265 [Phytophthora idaei]|nr:hypothetical protein PI125_g4265 [Phytophthora idaei]
MLPGAKLLKCQPGRNLLKHLFKCPHPSEPQRIQWVRFGEPAPPRRKGKRPTGATQDSVMTEALQLLPQPMLPFHFVDNISVDRKDHYQALVAIGFYAAGLSFRSIEMPRFRKALTILQPEMERYLPSRKVLAGRRLTAEYERELGEVIARLRDEPTIALVSNG